MNTYGSGYSNEDEDQTASSLYKELEARRQPFLDRARDCSRLSIPGVLPPTAHGKHSRLATPFQSLGARGVNNLASKLLLTLLPPNTSFFRLAVSPGQMEEIGGSREVQAEVEASLAQMEREVMNEIETTGIRVQMFEAIKHLLVTGNALIYAMEEGGVRLFHLDSYVVERDPVGNLLTIITKEEIAPKALPPEMLELIKGKQNQTERSVEVFTCVHRQEGGDFKIWQECGGVKVEGSDGIFKAGTLPFLALRLSTISNEDYGRGVCEEYMGDLRSLESLTKSIVEGAAASSRVIFLVNPNGTTRARVLAESPNGSIREGNAADVSTLQVNKASDFRVALETIAQIRERLMQAFLLNSSVQRQAERVTAEEIRYMAQELEQALGGVFSVLSAEMQMPLVTIIMDRLTKKGAIPKLPKGLVRPKIVTGLEALGRGQDLNRLDIFISGAMQTLGPEAILKHLNMADYLTRRATAVGIDTEGLIRSEEEVQQQEQQMQQQQQMMQMAEKLGPSAITAASKNAQQQPQQQPAEEQQ